MVSVGVSKLGITNLIFIDPGAKINGAYYRDVLLSQQLLPWCATCRASSSFFNRTTLLHIGHLTLCDFSSKQHLLSFHRIYGHQTVPTSIQWTKRYGASSRSESTSHGCTVSTNWSSVCFVFGMAWTKASLTAQLMNGVCLCASKGWTLRALVVTLSVCLSIHDMKLFMLC